MLVKFMLFVEVMDHIWMGREARAGKVDKVRVLHWGWYRLNQAVWLMKTPTSRQHAYSHLIFTVEASLYQSAMATIMLYNKLPPNSVAYNKKHFIFQFMCLLPSLRRAHLQATGCLQPDDCLDLFHELSSFSLDQTQNIDYKVYVLPAVDHRCKHQTKAQKHIYGLCSHQVLNILLAQASHMAKSNTLG